MERAAGESLRTTEIVLGVSPTYSATALIVTTADLGPRLLVRAMIWFRIPSFENSEILAQRFRSGFLSNSGTRPYCTHKSPHKRHLGAQRVGQPLRYLRQFPTDRKSGV